MRLEDVEKWFKENIIQSSEDVFTKKEVLWKTYKDMHSSIEEKEREVFFSYFGTVIKNCVSNIEGERAMKMMKRNRSEYRGIVLRGHGETPVAEKIKLWALQALCVGNCEDAVTKDDVLNRFFRIITR